MRQAKRLKNIRLGIKTLLLHKLRSFLTMMGVVFGVGSVVAMLAVGEGASKEALEEIRKLGSTNIIINSVKPIEDDSGSHLEPFGGSGRPHVALVDRPVIVDPRGREQGDVHGVIRMVMGQDHIGHLGRFDAEAAKGFEDHGPVGDHPPVDDDHRVIAPDEADGAGDAFSHISREQDVEFGRHGAGLRS